jgi:hypothetical protein
MISDHPARVLLASRSFLSDRPLGLLDTRPPSYAMVAALSLPPEPRSQDEDAASDLDGG